MGMKFKRDIQGRPWKPCGQCPYPDPNVCPSRRHRAFCDHMADDPDKWASVIFGEAPEKRPPYPVNQKRVDPIRVQFTDERIEFLKKGIPEVRHLVGDPPGDCCCKEVMTCPGGQSRTFTLNVTNPCGTLTTVYYGDNVFASWSDTALHEVVIPICCTCPRQDIRIEAETPGCWAVDFLWTYEYSIDTCTDREFDVFIEFEPTENFTYNPTNCGCGYCLFLPKTLSYSDVNGSCTLFQDPPGFPIYKGSYTFTTTGCVGTACGTAIGVTTCQAGSTPYYKIGTGTYTMNITARCCGTNNFCVTKDVHTFLGFNYSGTCPPSEPPLPEDLKCYLYEWPGSPPTPEPCLFIASHVQPFDCNQEPDAMSYSGSLTWETSPPVECGGFPTGVLGAYTITGETC